MAKALGARAASTTADDALSVHGGKDFALEYWIGGIICDARIAEFFGRAAEIQAQGGADTIGGGKTCPSFSPCPSIALRGNSSAEKRCYMIRDAGPADAAMIAEIYNDAALNTTAIWNTTQVDADNRAAWLETRQQNGFPVLVFEDAGQVLAYASFGTFRPFDGFDLSVEHSIYAHPSARGRGIGTVLLQALIARAQKMGMHQMVAAISADNPGSIRLHERLGFTQTGQMPEIGRKFGRWLDLVLLQKQLDTRPAPPAN
ncbi:GNAT family N-acetyltransferase [Rhodobacteraceae bacterium]|nr:GNAT family N-acetyltransferase [Paracoccaceae bacterium]